MENNTDISFHNATTTTTTDIILAILYGTAAVFGIFGNCLLIDIVRKNRSMHTATNFLLVNLAAADILTLLWCPKMFNFRLKKVHPRGLLGDIVCKFFTGNAIADTLAVCVSLQTLALIAVERYNALVKPMDSCFVISKRKMRYAIAIIWLISTFASLPDFILTRFDERYMECKSVWSLEMTQTKGIYVICFVVFLVFLPLLVITYCYFQIIRGLYFTRTICATQHANDKSKKKLAVLTISVAALFYVSYLPMAVFMLYLAGMKHLDSEQQHDDTVHIILLHVFEFLATANSSFNPVVYAFQSSNYKDELKRMFRSKSTRQPRVNMSMEQRPTNATTNV